MADDRPGFTPGEGGERAGRANARPRLTCSLATVSQEFAMRFSDAVKRHRAHGGDLGQCDAVRCSCGNEPHLNGFHTVHHLIGDGRWVVADLAGGPGGGPTQCFGCGAVYSESYELVEVAAIAPRDRRGPFHQPPDPFPPA
jgi:hypothetical protein